MKCYKCHTDNVDGDWLVLQFPENVVLEYCSPECLMDHCCDDDDSITCKNSDLAIMLNHPNQVTYGEYVRSMIDRK